MDGDHTGSEPAAGRSTWWGIAPWVWLLGLALAAVLGAAWVWGFWLYINHEDPLFISDQAFIAAANTECADAIRRRPPVASEDATFEQRAETVIAATLLFDSVRTSIAAIEVGEFDRDAVASWLADWEDFVGVGMRYAEAIRTGDPDVFEAIGNEADAPATSVLGFARHNGLTQCEELLGGGLL
jgi:hypothetical protein